MTRTVNVNSSTILPFPICARCGREVESMEVWASLVSAGLSVTVRCHGDKEETFLSNNQLMELPKWDWGATIEPGTAFKENRLQVG